MFSHGVGHAKFSHAEWPRPRVCIKYCFITFFMQRIEIATIPSVHHEQLVRSLDLRREADRL